MIIISAVVYLLFALWRLEWAVILLSLFFPAYFFKVNIFGIPFTLIELMIYSTTLACVIQSLRRYFSNKRGLGAVMEGFKVFFVEKESFFVRHKRIIYPVWVLVVAGFVSLLVVDKQTLMLDGTTVFEGQQIALGILKGWIIAPILLFSLYLSVLKGNKQILDVLNLYSLSAVFLAIWAIFQVSSESFITPDQRASGPFESANYLALYIAPALFYSMVRFKDLATRLYEVEKMSFLRKLFLAGDTSVRPETSLLLILFMILFLAIFATKSYAAIIAVALTGMIYFGTEYVLWKKNKDENVFNGRSLLVIILTFLALCLAVFALDPVKWEGVLDFEGRNSSSVRLEVYTISGGLVSENWLMGIGMGQFPLKYQLNAERFLGHPPYELNMLHPHNLFLAFWLNLGLLGLIAFVWIIVEAYNKSKTGFRDFYKHKIIDSMKLKVVGFCLLLVILLHGLVDTPFFKNDLALIFWLVIAVIFIPNHEVEKDEKKD